MHVYDAEGLVIGKKDVHVKALLTILISDTLEYFSVKNSMSDSQLGQTINLILEDYSLYKIDFFVYCFNCAKKGKYGTTFNRIDGQIIHDWIKFADADYTLEVEQQRVNEAKRLSHKNIGIPDPITSKNKIDELDDKNKPVPMPSYVKEKILSIGKNPIVKPEREVIRTEQQIEIDNYINEFNEIFEFHDDHKGGKRFIPFHSGFVDVSEFIQLRADRKEISIKAHEAWEKSHTFIYLPKLRRLLVEDLESQGYEFTTEEHPKNENLFKVSIDFN